MDEREVANETELVFINQVGDTSALQGPVVLLKGLRGIQYTNYTIRRKSYRGQERLMTGTVFDSS